MSISIIAGIAAVTLVVIVLLASYVKAPPSWAYIVSGLNRKPRTYIGKGGFRIPGFERLDKVFLGQITADIRTNRSVPTNDFINVNVDAVAKIQVNNSPEGLQLAAKNFLNMEPEQISRQVQDSLEGNMRECVGALSLREININRDKFSDEIMSKAQKDMEALGLTIISCNIQNVTDDKNLIEDLGADNTWSIKKQAKINRANAERDIAKAEAEARKEANDSQVDADMKIAERNNELSVKKSDLQVVASTKQAVADAAYAIQEQEQLLTINKKTVEAESARQILSAEKQKEINEKLIDAETAKAKKQQELTNEKIKIKQNELDANVNKQADAERYQTETNAAAELQRLKLEADAKAYQAKKDAEATIATAEAKKQQMILEAEGIKAVGDAEAYKIKAKGEAEADAMNKKADAYKQYGQAAILDMMVKILPDVTKATAEPISAIKDLRVYGTSGQDATGISGAVPTVIKQSFDVIESTTGINMSQLVQENTKLGAGAVTINKK